MKRSAVFFAVGSLVVLFFAYQNCSVRRLNTSQALSTGGGSVTGAPNSGATPAPGSCAADNMIQATTQGTITGITGVDPIQASYATVTVVDASSTDLNILANSECVSKNTYTTTTGACYSQSYPVFNLTITIQCDKTIANAPTCTRFLSTANTDVLFSEATIGIGVNVSALTIGANYETGTYMQEFTPALRKGSFRITSLPELKTGNVVTIKLTGAELNNLSDNTKKMTINGTFSGEIVKKTCTPGL